jgi:hypothetical protein
MRSRIGAWLPLIALTAALGSACAAGPGPTTERAASVSPTTPFSTSTPIPVQPAPNLALVTLRGSNTIVVRDITDINHPKTVSTLGQISAPQFVSSTELSYSNANGLVKTPLAGTPATAVEQSPAIAFAWSPDGSSVAYVVQTGSGLLVHLLDAGGDRLLGGTPPEGIGGCETVAGCAIVNSLDFRLSYSQDGKSISLVFYGFGGPVFRIWSPDGKLIRSSDLQKATMSVWSGDALYFRDPAGVQVWRGGADSQLLPGVAWIKPQASPAGGEVVYAARDSSGWAHTFVVDTTTRQVREIMAARTNPVFLTSRYIWYQGERACVAADLCGSQPPIHPLSGRTYIYDLQDGTETESIITNVYDVWPHAA